MIIYLIRHGQTVANAEKKFAGVWDVDLDETGIKQVESVAEKMKSIKLDAIYASPLIRALKTAQAISKHHNLSPQVMEALKEMNFGVWEGKSFEEIKDSDPHRVNQWFQDFERFQVPEGESLLEMYARTSRAFNEIVKDYDVDSDSKIAIVAHGGVIQALLSYLCYGDPSGYWRFGVDNCGVNKVEYVMGYPVIKAINQ